MRDGAPANEISGQRALLVEGRVWSPIKRRRPIGRGTRPAHPAVAGNLLRSQIRERFQSDLDRL